MPSPRQLMSGFAVATIAGVAAQPMRPVVVSGRSMSPTYADGAILWSKPVDRPLRRGDVVIADTPEGLVIKRVALLPGDRRIQWRSRGGWCDLAGFGMPRSSRSQRRLRSLEVPSGTVFLLGDNLDVSVDSRCFGPVSIARVRGLIADQRAPEEGATTRLSCLQRWIARGVFPARGG